MVSLYSQTFLCADQKTSPQDTRTISLEEFAHTISLVPSILKVRIPHPNNANLICENSAACFPIHVTQNGKTRGASFIANHHTFTLRDSLDRIILEVDSGRVFRNANDTVIAVRVKVIAKNSGLDLVLLELLIDTFPSQWGKTLIQISLDENRDPVLGERVLYSGFPGLMGEDPLQKQNYPLVLDGFVSQSIPGNTHFIVQAPVFFGSSGSPILSQMDGKFLGIIRAARRGQESLLYATKASSIRTWLKYVLYKKY